MGQAVRHTRVTVNALELTKEWKKRGRSLSRAACSESQSAAGEGRLDLWAKAKEEPAQWARTLPEAEAARTTNRPCKIVLENGKMPLLQRPICSESQRTAGVGWLGLKANASEGPVLCKSELPEAKAARTTNR